MVKNLLAFCKNRAGFLLVLVAITCTAVFVSCSDEFDDTQLKSEIKDLQDRVAQLEEKLSTEIESLRTLINGKVTVDTFAYDEQTGIYSVKLSDGKTLQVAKADAATNPVVSVVLEDGKYYWTVNGKPLTDAEGQQLPVEIAPGVRVNSSTNMWEISPDGGKTWLATGIKAAEEDAALISKVNDDDNYVYFTLADGTRIQVAKSTDFRCNVLVSKQYFTAGATRQIRMDLNGVAKSAIYSKPEGWKASIEENVVSITAPAQEAADAEQEGKVIVQVWFADRTSDIAEVPVLIGEAPHEIVVDDNMKISISTSKELQNNYDTWQGITYGAIEASQFSEAWLKSYIEGNTRLKWDFNYPYNSTLPALLGGAPEKGKSYVIWGLDKFGDGGYSTWYGEAIYTSVLIPNIEMTLGEVTYEDAAITVSPKGISGYYGGVFEVGTSTLDAKLAEIQAGGITLMKGTYEGLVSKYAMVRGTTPWSLKSGKTYMVYAAPAKADLKTLTVDDMYTAEVTIKPIVSGGTAAVTVDVTTTTTSIEAVVTRGAGTYKYYATYLTEMNMGKYAKDEDLLEYLITLPGQAEETYKITRTEYTPQTKGQIVAVGVDKNGKAGPILRKDATTNAIVYADKTVKVERTDLDFNTATFKLTPDAGIVKYRYYTNQKKKWNIDRLCGDGKEGSLDKTQEYMATATVYAYLPQIKEASCEDGKPVDVTLTKLTCGEDYVFFVVGFDAAGNPTKLIDGGVYMPDFKEGLIRMTNDKWKNSAARPTITKAQYHKYINNPDPLIQGLIPDEANIYELAGLSKEEIAAGGRVQVVLTVAPGEGCTEFYVITNNTEMFHMTDFYYKTAYVMTNGTKCTAETVVKGNFFTFSQHVVGIVWKDADGIYEAELIDLFADKRDTPLL